MGAKFKSFSTTNNSHAEIFSEPKNGYVGDVGSKEMTGTDKMALNTLYNCETVSSQVIIQFMNEENARFNSQFKLLDNKPFAVQCGWQDLWETSDSVITFDRLTIDEISGGSGHNGGLNINMGVFIVPLGHGFSGVWAITYSFSAWQYSGQYNQAWIFINGEQISESEHYTYNGDMAGDDSLGSRTLYMRLEAGDAVTLRTGSIEYLSRMTLCFELVRGNN